MYIIKSNKNTVYRFCWNFKKIIILIKIYYKILFLKNLINIYIYILNLKNKKKKNKNFNTI